MIHRSEKISSYRLICRLCSGDKSIGYDPASCVSMRRYDTGVISGALPYLQDDLLSEYKADVSKYVP